MILIPEKHRRQITNALLWLLVLIPIVGSVLLTRMNAVDQRFLDDWELAKYLVKFKEGTLHLSDLCAVYLEHRPILPRALSVGVLLITGGDVRGQNVLTMLFLLTGFAALARLWLKHGGATIREAWLPLLIAGVTLFTPAQWQTLLWGDCFYAVMPGMFLVMTLCLAFEKWAWWVRGLAGAFLAVLATLSFASGILIWVLPLPVLLACGAFADHRQRVKFAALWLLVMAAVFALYLQVKVQKREAVTVEQPVVSLPGGYVVTYDLRNAVPRQFAYGQENENTMARNTPYFLAHPGEDFDLVRAFSGILLMRGCATDTKTAAVWAGTVMLAGLGALAFLCWRYRKERRLFPMLFTMLCLGAYTPVTGLLVAVGRIWAGHVHTALNVRYHAHHPQIIIALAGAALFLMIHRARQRDGEKDMAGMAFCWVTGGVLLGILGMGWLYGMSMMDAWRSARLRNAAAQMVSQILPEKNGFVSYVSGNYDLTHDTVAALAKHGLLRTPLLKDPRLSNLHASESALGPDHAFLNRLWKEEGHWQCEGYASLLKTNRPADGILFAYRVPGGEWIIWGFTQGDGPPHYLPTAMGKDLWGIQAKDKLWPMQFMFPWSASPAIISEPPPGAEISVWAIDMARSRIYRIPRDIENKSGDAGDRLETLSQRQEPKD